MISLTQLLCEPQRDWQRKNTVQDFMRIFIETGGTMGLQLSNEAGGSRSAIAHCSSKRSHAITRQPIPSVRTTMQGISGAIHYPQALPCRLTPRTIPPATVNVVSHCQFTTCAGNGLYHPKTHGGPTIGAGGTTSMCCSR